MKITIRTPDFKAQRKLSNFVRANLVKLSALSDRIIQGDVLLKLDKSDTKEDKICELRLSVPGTDLFASRQSSTFEDAVLKCVEALDHQVRRWKDSINAGKLRGSATSFEPEEAPI